MPLLWSDMTGKTMKAIICARYGPPEVLQFGEVEVPTPKENAILVKVQGTTVTAADIRVRGFNVPLWYWLQARMYLGLRRPKRAILGAELAGEIESVGSNVIRFKEGDRVYASLGHEFGAYAEFRSIPESGIVAPKPSNLTYEEAATIPLGGLTALHFLRMGGIQSGQKVLVYGASGSVGAYTVQLARFFGATVTGVCSASNADLVRSLGRPRPLITRERTSQEDTSRMTLSLMPWAKFLACEAGVPSKRTGGTSRCSLQESQSRPLRILSC